MSQENIKKEAAVNQVFVTFFANGDIIQSYGVSNIKRISTGFYEIQFENPFANKYFSCSASVSNTGGLFVACTGVSPTQLNVQVISSDGHTPNEAPWLSVIAVGNVS
jgi:hypothetical protein